MKTIDYNVFVFRLRQHQRTSCDVNLEAASAVSAVSVSATAEVRSSESSELLIVFACLLGQSWIQNVN